MGLVTDLRSSIYEEHADEASFLYEQRGRWLEDAALSFDDVAELEQRREAHLDGLVLGGEAALQLVAARAIACEDAGIVDSSLRIACRHARADVCMQIVGAAAESGDAELLHGASDALCAELPPALTTLATDGLRSGDHTLVALWARVVGFRRLPLLAELRSALALSNVPPAHTAEIVWALGELAEPCPLSCRAALSTGSPALAQAVLLGTLKHSKLAGSDFELLEQSFPGWTAIPAVLAGVARYEALARVLRAADGDGRAQTVVALGLLGQARATPLLLELLGDAEAARPAAVALQLLTGASLLETEQIEAPENPGLDADLVDPDSEPADDMPEPRASTVTRLCQDAGRWSACLSRVATAPLLRWGAPLSELQTLHALSHTTLPLHVRGWLADELRIRLKHNIRFRPEMAIKEQRAALRALHTSVTSGRSAAAAPSNSQQRL
ncbi:MAG TPA: hypothetical protein VFN67_05455 [Polyangiales bacterium]|nr:hypothetical protein [Polyangiales bacterium]